MNLSEDERERLEIIEALAYSLTGQSINLVELCESWLASGNPGLQAIARYMVGGPESAMVVIDQALLETQPELMQALLHTFRGFLSEENAPIEAFTEYTAALQDVPPDEARDAILEARRRVTYVAN